jgi:hypothetical protein
VFKVVQEQELVLVALRGFEQVEERLGSTLCQSKYMSDGWNDEGRVADGYQGDHMQAIGEVTYHFSSDLEREARFANASCAGKSE